MRIARRFNAGNPAIDPQVPEGRPRGSFIFKVPLARPYGTFVVLCRKPSVETLGYCQLSLRDRIRQPQSGESSSALRRGFRKSFNTSGTRRAAWLFFITVLG